MKAHSRTYHAPGKSKYWVERNVAGWIFEVDFLFQTEEGRVIPIEAKAERNLRAKSLHSYCKRYANKLAIRASMSPYAVNTVSVPHSPQDKNAPFQYTLIDLPLFAISLIRDEISHVQAWQTETKPRQNRDKSETKPRQKRDKTETKPRQKRDKSVTKAWQKRDKSVTKA